MKINMKQLKELPWDNIYIWVDSMKEWIELLSVKPNTKDHSYRELMKELTKDPCIWEDVHSTSSKIQKYANFIPSI